MKTAKYLFLAAAAMAFAACSNDEDVANNGPVEAKVSASFGPESRTVNTDNKWTKDDAIGIMVTAAPKSTTGMIDRYKNVKYTADADGESSTFSAETGKGIFFQDASETVTFAAYYPYQTSAANALPGNQANGVITVNTQNNNTPDNQASIDFLFASGATASKGTPSVSFSGSDHQFKHRMAQLNLVITASIDHGFTADEAAAILGNAEGTYKLSGLIHEGTFNVTDGTTTTTGSAVSDWDITSLVHSDNDTKTRTYTLILLPQDKSSSALPFTAVIGGQTYTNTTDITPNLEAGNKYTYTITLKKTGMTVSGCTIAPWIDGTTGSGDATM